jgi:hypothetical protein
MHPRRNRRLSLPAATRHPAPGSKMPVWPCESQRASPDGPNDDPYLPPVRIPARYGAARASSEGDSGPPSALAPAATSQTLKPSTPQATPARSIDWATGRPPQRCERTWGSRAGAGTVLCPPRLVDGTPSFLGSGTKRLLSISPQKISGPWRCLTIPIPLTEGRIVRHAARLLSPSRMAPSRTIRRRRPSAADL